jgi:hydrogenase maturation protease
MEIVKILILGIGQSLRGDDGAGLEAVRLWRDKHPQTPANLRVETSELPGLGLLDLLDGMDAAVIVDAIESADPPGTIMRIGPDDLSSFDPPAGSAHGWGAAETLHLGRRLYPSLAHCRVTLIGIAAGQFTLGAGLSPAVVKALPGVVEMIEKEIEMLV